MCSGIKQYSSDQLLKEIRKTTVPDKDLVLNKNLLNKKNDLIDKMNPIIMND